VWAMGWYYLFELFAGANSPNQPCKLHAEKPVLML
jgi:hypothetical protein